MLPVNQINCEMFIQVFSTDFPVFFLSLSLFWMVLLASNSNRGYNFRKQWNFIIPMFDMLFFLCAIIKKNWVLIFCKSSFRKHGCRFFLYRINYCWKVLAVLIYTGISEHFLSLLNKRFSKRPRFFPFYKLRNRKWPC